MAQETLNRIKETELKAKQIIQDAAEQGNVLLEEARGQAQQYKEDLIRKSREHAASALTEAQSGMDKALEAAQARADAVVSQFGQTLHSKKDAAVKMVVEYII